MNGQLPYRIPRDLEELKKLLKVEKALGCAENVEVIKKLINHEESQNVKKTG